ncbi:hypothetical protein [Tenacibaculum finnmarkense]|uniref:SLOG domain-containing protein n=1 Tax=Tenacibaculum finnmarkense TaxID=2781243 RepID=UPI001EFA4649|nr:hypothetical protein [Tenacibaculum finnmarkense]MCG8795920.1 hypothetical protein [Tenacibaculum finnmarkense]MCG8798089.1 hypothetical protein [Tenacibaculum finnmarkense]
MARKKLKNIFLSASIPLIERDSKYYETTDVIAIRDAVIALSTTVLPNYKLIWGGHPSITPLINYVLQKLNMDIHDHIELYQSKFFEKFYPEDNNKFKNVILTPILENRDSSLKLMRELMLGNKEFAAGIFIGGMEGVEQEYKMFKKLHPNAIIIPLASSGAAAKIIYENEINQNERFLNDYAFSSTFKEFLIDKI